MKNYPRLNLLHALRYPFDLSPLLIIFVTAMFITGAIKDLILAIIGVSGLGLFSLWYCKYAFAMLIHTAEGHAEPPNLSDSMIRPFEDFRPIKLGIILFSHVLITGKLLELNLYLGYGYVVLILLLLPAIISILGMEDNLFKTFNFRFLLTVIRASGSWYWLSFSFYCAIAFALYRLYHTNITLFSAVFISLYLVMVSFHVIGLTLYARRDDLGFATARSPEQDAADERNATLQQYRTLADAMYGRYRQQGSIEFLESQLDELPLAAYDWFLHEILNWEIKPRFKRLFVQLYIRKQCAAKQPLKALQQYQQYKHVDTEFTIEDNASRLCLLNMALQKNIPPLINTFSNQLLQENKDKEHHQQALLCLLKFFMEQQPDDEKARQLLALLLRHYPAMQQDETIKQYATVLQQN